MVGQPACGEHQLDAVNGVVEWGIGRAPVAELLERCTVAKASPFYDLPGARPVTWLEPRARITVTYNELMGGRLSDPVFRGRLR